MFSEFKPLGSIGSHFRLTGRNIMSNLMQHRRQISRIRPQAAVLALAFALMTAVAATQSAEARTYHVLHSFTGGVDGGQPYAGLVRDATGNLYGTTVYGGASNYGTVFKVDTTGRETVLHSFTGGVDGAKPESSLVLDGFGNLYGTTTGGGASGYGTVFKLSKTGKETVLHSFGGADGATPLAGLIRDSNGNLYGTTYFGGAWGPGTVFKLDRAGKEKVLYSFTGGADGGYPRGPLVRDKAGNLYGTAAFGGNSPYGVVFKIDAAGTYRVLYRFQGAPDAAQPEAGLFRDANGNLYGTTTSGGAYGYGAVFMVDATGKETVLHSFSGADGQQSHAGLTFNKKGNLYGTTYFGGSSGAGTVFRLTIRTGKYRVLHSFAGGAIDGYPFGGVVLDQAGNLYGSTSGGMGYGGSTNGNVWRLTP
jgi:uncharacterized repeat protein (TIGR03803 family)